MIDMNTPLFESIFVPYLEKLSVNFNAILDQETYKRSIYTILLCSPLVHILEAFSDRFNESIHIELYNKLEKLIVDLLSKLEAVLPEVPEFNEVLKLKTLKFAEFQTIIWTMNQFLFSSATSV